MNRIGSWRVVLLGLVLLHGTAMIANADPRSDYILNCQGCHRPDGSGMPGGAPDFRGVIGDLVRVEGGRDYLLRVPGVVQSELDDARTAAVLNWLIHEFDARAGDFPKFTRDEVSAVRHMPLTDVGTRRAALLAKIGR